jgi:pyrroline-5-carboxylate reductase
MNILVIGAGNMGITYARSLLTSRFATADRLQLLIRNPQSRERLPEVPDGQFFMTAGDFIRQNDIVVLAVKPQDFPALSLQIQPYLQDEQLILSVMAGVSLQTLRESLKVSRLIRAMPNLPAQIGMGMTAFTCSPELDRKELFIIQNLLSTTGKALYVENEKLVDAATAVSGSGPAYVYYFMNAVQEAGVALGFSEAEAELLVNQMFMGAVHLQNQSGISCVELMRRVASRGGTTEAAFGILDDREVADGIRSAVYRAFERSLELGNAPFGSP